MPGKEDSRRIPRATDGTDWHALGARKPTALVAGDELVVFRAVTGLPDAGSVPLFGIGRVAVSPEGLT